jgi:hypothetical protein
MDRNIVIAKLSCVWGGENFIGTGIFLKNEDDTTYIAAPMHIVRRLSAQELPGDL